MGKEGCKNCVFLQQQIDELKRRLLAYENAHTPLSKRRRYPKREPTGNPVGAPKGHPGTTGPILDPDEIVDTGNRKV